MSGVTPVSTVGSKKPCRSARVALAAGHDRCAFRQRRPPASSTSRQSAAACLSLLLVCVPGFT
jgi:hypothetical protein